MSSYRSSEAHYPQDDESPLCCCEYRDRRGERAHVLGFCCACDEFDGAAEKLLTGKSVERDHLQELLKEIDDRMRMPLPGGAWHLGLPGVVPWLLLPIILVTGARSAIHLAAALASLLPCIYWWHRRALRLRRRSKLLLSWMLASIWYGLLVYAFTSAQTQARGSTIAWLGLLGATLALLARCKRADACSTVGVADTASALRRSHFCAVVGASVPRYDHYCSWVDEAVGSANHRAYLGFVASMLLVSCKTAVDLWAYAAEWYGWSWRRSLDANQSSLALSVGCYSAAVGAAVGALLLHQLSLLLTGRTAHEARRYARHARTGQADADAAGSLPAATASGAGVSRESAGCHGYGCSGWRRHVAEFLAQTAPMIGAAAAPRGRRAD